MAKISSFLVSYDSGADVLYISTAKEAATKGIEDNLGIVWRYGRGGKLIGATVMDFREIWSEKSETLANEIAIHFQIPSPQALNVVEHALEASQ